MRLLHCSTRDQSFRNGETKESYLLVHSMYYFRCDRQSTDIGGPTPPLDAFPIHFRFDHPGGVCPVCRRYLSAMVLNMLAHQNVYYVHGFTARPNVYSKDPSPRSVERPRTQCGSIGKMRPPNATLSPGSALRINRGTIPLPPGCFSCTSKS